MTTPRRIAIVGASLAGVRAAQALRRKGYDGAIALIGEERELPYDRPPLSKQVLTGEKALPRQLESESFYDNIELHLGARAAGLNLRDRSVELEDGSRVEADDIIVATGSLARSFPALDGMAGITTFRTLRDAYRVREAFAAKPRVAVVGGGFIGCEIAASARKCGLEVTLIEQLHSPVMRGLGGLVGETISALHTHAGVQMRLGVTVDSFRSDKGTNRLRLSDGTALEAELVIVGVGANPRTDWLEASGLQLGDGVICDDRCRVQGGDGHVWAAGDVASWPSSRFGTMLRIQHWTNAVEQATHVAANLLSQSNPAPYDPVPYLWSDQYQHKYQLVGLISGSDDTTLLHGSLRSGPFAVAYSREGRLRGVVACDMPDVIAATRSQIGKMVHELELG